MPRNDIRGQGQGDPVIATTWQSTQLARGPAATALCVDVDAVRRAELVSQRRVHFLTVAPHTAVPVLSYPLQHLACQHTRQHQQS